jgi:hypothetical protein
MFVGEVFRIDRSKLKEKVKRLLKEMELSDDANKRIGGYSTGMKQRLGIAQSLINDPKVLFLDEPISECCDQKHGRYGSGRNRGLFFLDANGRHAICGQIFPSGALCCHIKNGNGHAST